MKKYLCYAGIDVSKSKLDVSLLTDASQKGTPHLIIPNDAKGIKQLLKQLAKGGFGTADVLFTFEDTGIYSLPLACYLSEHGLDYWMVPVELQ